MLKVIIYTRVSTDEQAKSGLSLENQEKSCRDFATNSGYQVEKVFREEGVSAKTTDRKELISLIDYCRENKGKVHALIVWKVDRFARKAEDHLTVKAILAKYGVRLVSVTEPIEDNTTGRLMETMLAAFAQFDNDVRTERSTKGIYSRVEQGGWPFYAPLGYKNYKDSLGRPTLLPDPSRSELVKQLFSEYSKGTYTSAVLSQYAWDIGLRSRSGHRLSKQSMFNILGNRAYIGRVQSKITGDFIPAIHKPLISEDMFAEVQAVLVGKGKKLRPVRDENWPLRAGFVKCAECGSSLTGSSPKGRSKHYPKYSCPKCRTATNGKPVSVGRETMHEEFSALLEVIRPEEHYLKLFKQVVLRQWNNEYKELASIKATTEKDLAALDEKRQRILDLFIDGKLSDEDRDSQIAKLEGDRIAIRLRRKELDHEVEDKEAVIEVAIDFMRNVSNYWRVAPVDLQKRFQYLVFPYGIAFEFGKGFRTAKLAETYGVVAGLDADTVNNGGGGWS